MAFGKSLDSSVGIVTGYGPNNRGVMVRAPVDSRIFLSPRRRDRLWGPPSLLSNFFPPELTIETFFILEVSPLHALPNAILLFIDWSVAPSLAPVGSILQPV
jgi:hypothetical protein